MSPVSAQSAGRTDVWSRLEELTASVQALLNVAVSASGKGAEGVPRRTLDRLGADLGEAGGRSPDRDDLFASLTAFSHAHTAVREHALEAPFQALGRLYDVLDRVRQESSIDAVLAAAPAELCAAGAFDRAMFSRVRGSTWLPECVHVAHGLVGDADAELTDFIADLEIPLTSSLLEAELVRRRRAALVVDPQNESRVYGPLVEKSRTRAYVVAPIIAGASVVGLMHADTYLSRRTLTTLDRDLLQTFADGIGLVCERAVLLERLAGQRERILAAFSATETVIDSLADAPMCLDRPEPSTPSVPTPVLTLPRETGPDRLTAREREVLVLMSGGATNAQIADQLTVSETTVKSHVKHILRKFNAANRTEAIARWLRTSKSAGWQAG